MPTGAERKGLCLTCSKEPTCTFPGGRDHPLVHCEEFTVEEPHAPRAVMRSSRSAVLRKAPDLKTGLCCTCENLETCQFPKARQGVVHCEEYRWPQDPVQERGGGHTISGSAERPIGVNENGQLVYGSDSPETMLRHLRNVTDGLLRGALDVWASLWEELQERVSPGVMILPDARKGFTPSCGWPEFLERMWEIKHYLDSTYRFIQQQ